MGKLELAFAPMGGQRVKNIAEPVEAWRVVLARPGRDRRPRRLGARAGSRGAAACLLLAWARCLVQVRQPMPGWRGGGGRGAAAPGRPSVTRQALRRGAAVRQPLGGGERPNDSPDGLTEDVITDLSRYRELFVIARNSTTVYKGKPADLRQIGQELGVRYVLEGSILQ